MTEEIQRGERGPMGDKGYHGQTGEKGDPGKPGVKGEKGDAEPIHPWRWRGITVWIVVFTAIVFYSLQSTRDQSATLRQLQATNCSLKNFLLTAQQARLNTASHETGVRRKQDLQAAGGYKLLADRFTEVGKCKFTPIRGVR